MSHRHSIALAVTPLVKVYDVLCHAPRSDYEELELAGMVEIVIPRRGVFIVERRGIAHVIDPTVALVFGAEEEYRVSHPTSHGDDCTVVLLEPELLEQVLGGFEGAIGHLTARDHLSVCLVTKALRLAESELEAEDATLLLLSSISGSFRETAHPRVTARQRQLVEQTCSLLASYPGRRWDISTIAGVVHSSPYHLARQFRAVTGDTIAHYLLRQRLAQAVDRLAEGEQNLAMLAVDTGFAHHSHFSARFRHVYGMTPREAREMLTRRNLERMRLALAN